MNLERLIKERIEELEADKHEWDHLPPWKIKRKCELIDSAIHLNLTLLESLNVQPTQETKM